MSPHLTPDERRILAGLLHRKISVARIAVQLGSHLSTIHPEIRRNFWHDPEVPMAAGYWHNPSYLTVRQTHASHQAPLPSMLILFKRSQNIAAMLPL